MVISGTTTRSGRTSCRSGIAARRRAGVSSSTRLDALCDLGALDEASASWVQSSIRFDHSLDLPRGVGSSAALELRRHPSRGLVDGGGDEGGQLLDAAATAPGFGHRAARRRARANIVRGGVVHGSTTGARGWRGLRKATDSHDATTPSGRAGW